MKTPTWDQFIRPVLELAGEQDLTRQIAFKEIPSRLKLSDEVLAERLNSGARRIDNRIGWAMSHLTKAGLIEKVKRATYRLNEKGVNFLNDHKGVEITHKELKNVAGYKEAWKSASQAKKTLQDDGGASSHEESTPDEAIENALHILDSNLRDELIEQLAKTDPFFFEQVVIDLLFAMGYGGSREEAATVTQKSNDGGIDGIINEDRLGLDVIYVQAKRWQNTINRVEIQNFVGALAGKQANKGVFITTSDYSQTAIDFAAGVSQKVILIDGIRLADLMIEHDIGVSTQRMISIKRIDTDYFEEI